MNTLKISNRQFPVQVENAQLKQARLGAVDIVVKELSVAQRLMLVSIIDAALTVSVDLSINGVSSPNGINVSDVAQQMVETKLRDFLKEETLSKLIRHLSEASAKLTASSRVMNHTEKQTGLVLGVSRKFKAMARPDLLAEVDLSGVPITGYYLTEGELKAYTQAVQMFILHGLSGDMDASQEVINVCLNVSRAAAVEYMVLCLGFRVTSAHIVFDAVELASTVTE